MNENRKKIIIYIVVLLIVLAIIFGVFLLMRKNNSTGTVPVETNKNLFGYFTKNKPKSSTDTVSNGTTIVDGTNTIVSNTGGTIQNGNTITGQNNQNNNGTNGSGTGGGTTTFNAGNGTSTTLGVATDTVTGLPTDVITLGNNTGGGSGLGTSSTTGSGTTGVGTSGTTGGTVTDTQCRDGDTVQYRVSQPQGDVVFAEDGELISDDRVFPPNTLAISALGIWNSSQYKKIKECIPPQDTVDITPFEPITTNQPTEVFDACRIIRDKSNPSDTEMRDCVLYRTWNVWTYPDNYIKDPSWNEDSINRSQFQSMKTKIRTDFNNITEKISSERSFSNTEYDLRNLINHKKLLSELAADCLLLRTKIMTLVIPNILKTNTIDHKKIADTLSLQFGDFKTSSMQSIIKNIVTDPNLSLFGTPAGQFEEINFINGTKIPDSIAQSTPESSIPAKLGPIGGITYRGATMNYPDDSTLHKDGISWSFFQRKQPQNILELFTKDEDLNLFCKLTDASISYTYPATGTTQNNGYRLYCDQVEDKGIRLDPYIPTGNNTTAISSKFNGSNSNNYKLEPNNWWYRATQSYLIYKLYKDN